MNKMKHPTNIIDFNKENRGFSLAGLISGDGCFSSDRLRIIYHLKDIKAAQNLQLALGFGKIYRVKNKQAVNFQIATKVGLQYVVNLVNGKFVGPEKINQLIRHNYSKRLGVDILPPKGKVSLKNAWLAGFFDADGSAQIIIGRNSTMKSNKQTALFLSFTQKKAILLDCIAALFMGQKVEMTNHKKTEKRKVATTGYAFRIRSLKLLPVLFDYFDEFHLQGRKYGQLLKVKECYALLLTKQHLTESGFQSVLGLQKELREMEISEDAEM